MPKKREKLIIIFSILAIAISLVVVAQKVIAEVRIGSGHNLNMQSSNIINIGGTGGVDYEAANKGYVGSAINWNLDTGKLYVKDTAYNVGIGLLPASVDAKLDVGGNLDMNKNQILQMRIENRTTNPASPGVGQIWICTDVGNDCQ